mgnify:CR=1 FL=1
MKPRLNTELKKVTDTICTRPVGGFFITRTFLKKTCFQLTKVNKQRAIYLLSITYNESIFPVVKRGICVVNKICPVSVSACNVLALYHITTSTSTFLNYLCASGVKPDFCIYSFRAWLVQKLGALYNPLLIFEFCFFT